MKVTEFSLSVGGRRLDYSLAEPDGRLAEEPALLLSFSGHRAYAMTHDLYADAARVFVGAGHRALSYSMPYHGEREVPGRGSELHGIRDGYLAGEDPFAMLVEEGIAAIDEAQRRGWVTGAGVYAFGVSRGGYSAIRLAAADPRIAACAALAPVADWRVLREWSDFAARPELAGQALENFVAPLVGRCVYTIIGNHDDRVRTDKCVAFYAKLLEAEAAAKIGASAHELHVINYKPGHALPEEAYSDVPRWLLGRIGATTPGRVPSNMP